MRKVGDGARGRAQGEADGSGEPAERASVPLGRVVDIYSKFDVIVSDGAGR